MKIKSFFDKKTTAGFGEISKTRPTATFNEYIRCATHPAEDGGMATVEVTPMTGYEVVHAIKTESGSIKIHVAPAAQPVLGRSYMLDGKHVVVGKIDRDEQGNAVAVYDEHTREKHLWPSASQAPRA
jgi:hypothetical protein